MEIPKGGVFEGGWPESKTRRGRYIPNLCPTIISANMEIYVYEGENNTDRKDL